MSQQIVSASQIKDAVNNIRQHHHACYNQIEDLNKLLNVHKEEWPVNEVLDTFKVQLEIFEKKRQSLNDKINRKETKIFLFGKVSVGKSKVLNCLLRSDLFVSSVSHTTSCFVHVMKSQDSRYVIKYKNKEETFDHINNLKERIKRLTTSHDMANQDKLDVDESIEFYIPIEDNKILKEGTHVIDCPGEGEQSLITNAIAKHSEDADIFIFVISNTLTEDDKQFFKYQSEVSCKPDIFILVNKWDESDQDAEMDTTYSKQTIIKQCSDFLTAECGMDCSKIADRIFFISAKEIFIRQVKCLQNQIQQRCESFEQFEQQLEQYIANPQQNKTRRYQTEIDQDNRDIMQKWGQVRRQILDLRPSCDNLTKLASELKYSLMKPFHKFKFKLHKQIKETVDKIDDKDLLNEDLVITKIALLGKELDEQIQTFLKDKDKIINKYFKDNSIKSNETINDNKIGKFNIMNIPQYSPSRMPDETPKDATETLSNITKSIVEEACAGLNWMSTNPRKSMTMAGAGGGIVLSSSVAVLPTNINRIVLATIGGAVIVMALVGGAIYLWSEYCKSPKSKNIQTAKDQLKIIKADIFKKSEDYIDKMQDHYNTKIPSIIDEIEKLKELTDGYWDQMERILGPWQDMI